MLKVSQVVKASALLLALFASQSGWAVVTEAVTIRLTVPNPINCSAPTEVVDFEVAGNISGIVNQQNMPRIEVYAVSLNLSNSTLSCPANFSGPNSVKLGDTYTTMWQGGPTVTLTPALTKTNFNSSVQIGSLPPCNGTTTGNWGLCAYVFDPTVSPTTPAGVSDSAAILLTSGSSSSTSSEISISGPLGGDRQISFDVTAKASYSSFTICYTTNGADVSALTASTNCSGSSLKFATTSSGSSTGTTTAPTTTRATWTLDKDGSPLSYVPYWFKVQGPGAGTVWSNVLDATPVDGKSALELYSGPDEGLSFGCDQTNVASSPSALLGLAALMAMAFCLSPSRRRRLSKSHAKIALSAMLMTMSSVSLADSGQVTLGLIGSPYKPNIDANRTFPVYKCLFRDATLPLIGAQFDFHVADPFGSIRVGFAAGYTWANGNAYTGPAGPCNTSFLAPGISVGFQSVQLRPRITYVFDPYLYNFPFAPFARLGVVGAGYYFTYQGNPDTLSPTGVKPAGIRFGWEATAGLVFMLDSLEPRVAKRARASGVYSHSYLSFEVAYSSVNDFGTTGLDLSPAGMAGSNVPLLVTLGLVVELQ